MLAALFLAGEVSLPISSMLALAGWITYFMPTIFGRHQPNIRIILLLNIFSGWTIIGWFVALHLALRISPAEKEAAASHRLRHNNNNNNTAPSQ